MKRPRRQFLYLAAGFAALSACARLFWPQTYPTRPVRIVVGVRPDGPLNLSARLMGQTVWAVALLAGCLLPPGLSAEEVAGNARIRVTLGEPKQVLTYRKPDALGLFNVPDMHTAVLQRPDKSFLLWITGNVGPSAGSVARLSTTDFLHYENAGPGTATRAEPVMVPSCRADAQRVARPVPSCLQNPDADYVGANFVMSTGNGQDLVMFYEAGNKSIGDKTIGHGWEYNVIARARSTDNGVTWKREDVILSGADPKPTERTDVTQPGISEPGAIVANGYIYIFYQYVPNLSSAPDAPSAIQMARAPLEGGGAAGTWMKYDQGSFSQPGVGGSGSPIVGTGGSSGCTRPVEVWPAFSTYLNAYVLTFLCNEGWFFSTSTDLVAWTAPVNFMPMKMWQPCQPMDWNYVLVTPGSQAGVIGRTGYVLYAHTDRRGMDCSNRFSPHMLWVRPFSFEKAP